MSNQNNNRRIWKEVERPRPAVWLLVLVLTVWVLAACEEQLVPAAFVRNQTGQAIDVYEVVDDQEELVASLDEPVGGSFDQELFFTGRRFPTGCTTGTLVARTPEGAEVARLTKELCIGEGWVIEPDGSSHKFP